MELILTPVEARIVGSLIEKEIITPDNYPLTLNSLVNACNQKSSREPVMALTQNEVMNAIYELRHKQIVIEKMGADSRVPKYEHIVLDMFDFSDEELSVICLLLLRGPQTPGEIKTRCSRLYEFTSPAAVESVLEGLTAKDGGPFVIKLPKQAGRREARYAHLLCGDIEISEETSTSEAVPLVNYKGNSGRLDDLEERVTQLEQTLQAITEEFTAFKKEFE